MPDLTIEFSKYDFIAVLFPGSLIVLCFFTRITPVMYNRFRAILKTDAAYFFVLALGFIILSFILGKVMSQFAYWILEKFLVVPKKKKLDNSYELEKKLKGDKAELEKKIKVLKDKTEKSKEDEERLKKKEKELRGFKKKFKKNKIKRLGYPSYNLFMTQEQYETYNYFKHYRAPLDKKFQDKFLIAYRKKIDKDFIRTAYFPLLYSYSKQHCSDCASRLTTFSAIYHFFRSLTLTFPTVVLGISLHYAISHNILYLQITLPFTCLILSGICFIAYLRYFKIFSTEVINSFYVAEALKKKEEKKPEPLKVQLVEAKPTKSKKP